MVPFMAMYSALSFKISDKEDEAKEMMDLIQQYKQLEKSNWNRQDRWAFELHTKMLESPKESAMLNLLEAMAFKMRCTYWMSTEDLHKLREMISTQAFNKEDSVRATSVVAETLYQEGNVDAAIRECNRGIAMGPSLNAEGRLNGAIPFMMVLRANIFVEHGQYVEAKALADEIDAISGEYKSAKLIMFKVTALRSRIRLHMSELYTKCPVGARGCVIVEYRVPAEMVGQEIRCEWVLEAYNIDFRGAFVAENQSGEELIPPVRFLSADLTASPPDSAAPDASPSPSASSSSSSSSTPSPSSSSSSSSSAAPTTVTTRSRFSLPYSTPAPTGNNKRYDSGTMRLSYVPSQPGVLRLVWDNAFSYLRGKEIKYRMFPSSLRRTDQPEAEAVVVHT